eukprot:SM000179S03416  [mRNA]  locus=s179:277257:287158:- [translate_table: standard]
MGTRKLPALLSAEAGLSSSSVTEPTPASTRFLHACGAPGRTAPPAAGSWMSRGRGRAQRGWAAGAGGGWERGGAGAVARASATALEMPATRTRAAVSLRGRGGGEGGEEACRAPTAGLPPAGDEDEAEEEAVDETDDDEEPWWECISDERYRALLTETVRRQQQAYLEAAIAARTTVAARRAAAAGAAEPDPHPLAAINSQGASEEPCASAGGKEGQLSRRAKQRASRAMQAAQARHQQLACTGLPELASTSCASAHALLELTKDVAFAIPPLYDDLATGMGLPTLQELAVPDVLADKQFHARDIPPLLASDVLAKRWSLQANSPPARTWGDLWPRQAALLTKRDRSRQDLPVLPGAAPSPLHKPPLSPAEDAVAPLSGPRATYGERRKLQRMLDKEKRDAERTAREETEMTLRYWLNLVRRELPRHHKSFAAFHKKQAQDLRRVADICQREVRNRMIRSVKAARGTALRTKRLSREMLLFYRKMEREQAELKRKEEKDAAEARRREEELREARRQQQRLNFLITQTELYSHFMREQLGGVALSGGEQPDRSHTSSQSEEEAAELAVMEAEARQAAETAASSQQQRTSTFDSESQRLRSGDGMPSPSRGASDINLLHPSTMPAMSEVAQPRMFSGTLKEYQLQGLQWLVNLYEQGLNGILADEMGLGKTIQAMSFLAHLAEEKSIWGPFLVVAPASVLSNWADEISRFLPDIKVLPYWGGLQERTVLRKNINPKRLYCRDAAFHVLITSYQLLVLDDKYLRRVKWQYMVLDEAQAIKSTNSMRWKTLLSFSCRNRLLLTGTPIQNTMAELWALLHFIMPTLFDNHEQFNEWFSKGIESHAEHGGGLNEHQLSRLHAILKPFMLRRVKKDVESEISNKTEITVQCPLNPRQQALYKAIKNKISLADILSSSGGGAVAEKKVLHLMNIVIQLRKVCNHPELFERNEPRSSLHFAMMPNPLVPPPFGALEEVHFAGRRSLIEFRIPKLLYNDGMRSLPTWAAGSAQGFQLKWLDYYFFVFSPDNMHSSPAFSFARCLGLSPAEIYFLASATLMERSLFEPDPCEHGLHRVAILQDLPAPIGVVDMLVVDHSERLRAAFGLLRATWFFVPAARAPQPDVWCADRGFTSMWHRFQWSLKWLQQHLFGCGISPGGNAMALPSHPLIQERSSSVQCSRPLLSVPASLVGLSPPVQTFDFAKMLNDSGKLQMFDVLLRRLRSEGHKVLVFAQMTKMLNILEDYMNFRKYKYLRLDGSSTITDRRDMVKDFQHKQDIFVFLLSTRAGGLGINLTAADTVIFYESDWNPTMDLQAMDRAHRLGQTREVTVYRMICTGTVEEKIVRRASQKNTVQQLVMTGGQATQGDVFEAGEVVSLLLDDAELEQQLKQRLNGLKAPQANSTVLARVAPKICQDLSEDSDVVQERGKRKRSSKDGEPPSPQRRAVLLDAEGNAVLEEALASSLHSGSPAPSTAPSDNGMVVPARCAPVGKMASREGKSRPPRTPKVRPVVASARKQSRLGRSQAALKSNHIAAINGSIQQRDNQTVEANLVEDEDDLLMKDRKLGRSPLLASN